MKNIHLGCNTLVCVHASSAASGGVSHSRSQHGSGSRLCFRDNHTHCRASLQRWAAHGCLVVAHWEVHPLEEKKTDSKFLTCVTMLETMNQ